MVGLLAQLGSACFGPVTDSQLYGPQCCFDARCYEPESGANCVTDFGSEPLRSLSPPGSGTCGCQVQEQGRPFVAGPYAPHLPRTNDSSRKAVSAPISSPTFRPGCPCIRVKWLTNAQGRWSLRRGALDHQRAGWWITLRATLPSRRCSHRSLFVARVPSTTGGCDVQSSLP